VTAALIGVQQFFLGDALCRRWIRLDPDRLERERIPEVQHAPIPGGDHVPGAFSLDLSGEAADRFAADSGTAHRRRVAHGFLDCPDSWYLVFKHTTAFQMAEDATRAQLPKSVIDLVQLRAQAKEPLKIIPGQAVRLELFRNANGFLGDGAVGAQECDERGIRSRRVHAPESCDEPPELRIEQREMFIGKSSPCCMISKKAMLDGPVERSRNRIRRSLETNQCFPPQPADWVCPRWQGSQRPFGPSKKIGLDFEGRGVPAGMKT